MPDSDERNEEMEFGTADFRKVLWRSLGPPMRPSEAVTTQLLEWIDASSPALVLGATPEFVSALAVKGCERITVVDRSDIALEVMRNHLREAPPSLELFCDDWLSFLDVTRMEWSSVIMDCGLLFIETAEQPVLLRAIADALRVKRGAFVSRQLVRGSPPECQAVWRTAITQAPTRESVSCLYVANAIMAADFGNQSVSYSALQRMARKTLDVLQNRYGDQLDPVHSSCIEAFLRVDTHSPDFVPQMKRFPSLAELELLLADWFRNVSIHCCGGELSSYYRLICAGGPL